MFPTEPVNGQTYNRFKYNSSTLAWEIDTSITPTISYGESNGRPLVRSGFYRYYTTDSIVSQYVHLKTSYTMSTDISFCVRFSGYAYGEQKPVKAIVAGRINAGAVGNVGSSGSHVCGAYKSSDNYLVLTLLSGQIYFLGFSLDQFLVDNKFVQMNVLASRYTSSSTGAY